MTWKWAGSPHVGVCGFCGELAEEGPMQGGEAGSWHSWSYGQRASCVRVMLLLIRRAQGGLWQFLALEWEEERHAVRRPESRGAELRWEVYSPRSWTPRGAVSVLQEAPQNCVKIWCRFVFSGHRLHCFLQIEQEWSWQSTPQLSLYSSPSHSNNIVWGINISSGEVCFI